jgi:hypothetical protein
MKRLLSSVLLVAAMSGCGHKWASLRPTSGQYFVLEKDHVREAERGLFKYKWLYGLRAGRYALEAENEEGLFFLGEGRCVLILSGQQIEEYRTTGKVLTVQQYGGNSFQGGLWLPKQGSHETPKLFNIWYSGLPSEAQPAAASEDHTIADANGVGMQVALTVGPANAVGVAGGVISGGIIAAIIASGQGDLNYIDVSGEKDFLAGLKIMEGKPAPKGPPAGAPGQPPASALAAGSAKPIGTDQTKVAGAQKPPAPSKPEAAPATASAESFTAREGETVCTPVHVAGDWSICEIPGQSLYVWSSTPGSPAARFSTSGRDWRLYHQGKVWAIKLPDCVRESTVNCNGVDRSPLVSPWDLAVTGQVTPTPALRQAKLLTLGHVKVDGSLDRIRISMSDGELIDFLAGASRISVRPGNDPKFRISIWRGDTLP